MWRKAFIRFVCANASSLSLAPCITSVEKGYWVMYSAEVFRLTVRTWQDSEFVTFFIFVQADGAYIIVVPWVKKTGHIHLLAAFNQTNLQEKRFSDYF